MALSGVYDIFQHWSEQTCYIYSDPHFSDEDLECGIKNRPSDEEQIRSINAKCGRKDTLIILGDIGNIECVRKLRAGRKILIMGNHDSGATKYKRKIIQKEYNSCWIHENAHADMQQLYPNWKISSSHLNNGWIICEADNCLFDEVYEGPLIIGEKLILSHEPIDVPWAFNIHGHIHDFKHKDDKYHFNVCSDVIEYTPINMNQLLKSGILAHIDTIHRQTIDTARERKRKRKD